MKREENEKEREREREMEHCTAKRHQTRSPSFIDMINDLAISQKGSEAKTNTKGVLLIRLGRQMAG